MVKVKEQDSESRCFPQVIYRGRRFYPRCLLLWAFVTYATRQATRYLGYLIEWVTWYVRMCTRSKVVHVSLCGTLSSLFCDYFWFHVKLQVQIYFTGIHEKIKGVSSLLVFLIYANWWKNQRIVTINFIVYSMPGEALWLHLKHLDNTTLLIKSLYRGMDAQSW